MELTRPKSSLQNLRYDGINGKKEYKFKKSTLKLKENQENWELLMQDRKNELEQIRKRFNNRVYQCNREISNIKTLQLKSTNELRKSKEDWYKTSSNSNKTVKQFYSSQLKLYHSITNLFNKEMIQTENDAMRIGVLYKHFEKINKLPLSIHSLEIAKRNCKADIMFYGYSNQVLK